MSNIVARLRAEIKVRDNYTLPCWGKVDEPNWLVEKFNNIAIKAPFNNYPDLIPLRIKSTLNSIIVEVELFLQAIEFTDGDLSFFGSKEVMMSVKKRVLLNELEVRINDLFIALQISQPGRFDFLRIILFLDEKQYKPVYYEKLLTPASTEISMDFGNVSREIIDVLDFFKVWNWLINQKEYWDEVPKSKVGILLNYFRYFHYDSSPLAIVWIAMALEAILVTNPKFSQSQISGKLKVLLKQGYDEERLNKHIKDFYKLRSKIVHGKQKLFRPTLLYNGLSSVEGINDTVSENGSFGYSAVIYCIQLMIKTNRNNLEFKEEIIYTLLD